MAAALAITLLGTHAFAGNPPDQVRLGNGGVIKGEILVLDPGKQVVISVPGEEFPRTIPWSEVSDVQRAEDMDVAEPPPPQPTGPPAPRRVKLHVRADDPDVEVHSVQSTSVGMVADQSVIAVNTKLECRAPCNKELQAEGVRYFFAGPGVPASNAFFLDRYQTSATADVDAGSPGMLYGGYLLFTFGGTGMITGGVFLGLAYALDEPETDLEPFKIAGGVMLGVGTGMLAGGIALLVAGQTDFELSPETMEVGGIEVPTGRFRF